MKTVKLKPCPFCGGKAEMHEMASLTGATICRISCVKCECGTAIDSYRRAKKRWNQRTND
jgi:Lar family restriction alleviation protein